MAKLKKRGKKILQNATARTAAAEIRQTIRGADAALKSGGVTARCLIDE